MDHDHSKFFEYFNLLKKRKKLLINFNIIIVIISIIIALLLPKWYKSTATILVSNSTSALGMLSSLGGLGIGGLLGGSGGVDHNRYLAILYSRTLMEDVILNYNLIDRYGVDNMEEAVESLNDNIDVEVGDEMQIFVSVYDTNQEQVAEMTRFVVKKLDSLNISLSTENAVKDRDFISSRVNIVFDSLETLEKRLNQFMEENGVLDLTNQVIFGLESAAKIKAELLTKEVEFQVASKQTSTKNPLVKNLETQIDALEKQYSNFFSNDGVENLIPSFKKIPSLYKEFMRIKRDMEYSIRILEFLAPQYEQAKIEAAKDIPTLQILDEPARPERKSKPIRALIVLVSLFLSSLISFYYVYWKEYFLKQTA